MDLAGQSNVIAGLIHFNAFHYKNLYQCHEPRD